MNLVARFFVFAVTILSVLLVGITVSFVARTENWKEKYDAEAMARKASDATATARQTEINLLKSKNSEDVAVLMAETVKLKGEVNSSMVKVNDAETARAKAESEATRASADMSRLTGAVELNTAQNKALSDELNLRRDALIDEQTKRIQLADRNNELEAQVDSLGRERKRLIERIATVETKLSEAETKLAGFVEKSDSEKTAPVIVPPVPIRGQVVRVQKVDDATFVEINVGAKDGVQENTKFLLHRGSNFLGTLIVTSVEAKAAAGRATLIQDGINKGDEVLAGGY